MFIQLMFIPVLSKGTFYNDGNVLCLPSYVVATSHMHVATEHLNGGKYNLGVNFYFLN